MSIRIKTRAKTNNNNRALFNLFKKFSSKFNPTFLNYIRVIWIICILIILYNCVISVIIWLIKQTFLKWFWNSIFIDLQFIKWPTFIFELIVKNPYVLSLANILFAVITVLWIVFYIALLICLFIWSIIPWPFVTDREEPRKWGFFVRLKDVFDVFEFKVSIFSFTFRSFIFLLTFFFPSKKKEKFSNQISTLISKLNSPYVEEINKDFYDSTKRFYEKGDTYSVNYIKAQNHNVEANIINKLKISTNKKEYEKNNLKNTYINNGLEEYIKKASP